MSMLVKNSPNNPPELLKRYLDDPPIVGNETREEYNAVFDAIASSVMPVDALSWLQMKEIVDLSWCILRERKIHALILELAQRQIVLELLKETAGAKDSVMAAGFRIFEAEDWARHWATCPESRKQVEDILTEKGYPPLAVLAKAHVRVASELEAVSKRIMSYEIQRTKLVWEVERRNEKFARDLKDASSRVIEGEFSQAAE